MSILFLSDWEKYPNAIVDTETVNQSFVRLSALYKSMGVKNHTFLLALHDPSLQGIDPHDPYIDKNTMRRVAIECHTNFWYYIREVARIPDTDKKMYVKANRGILSMYWLYLNHIQLFLIMVRQTGKSLGADLLVTWLMNMGTKNSYIAMVTKDDTLRSGNLSRLKELSLDLPFYLRQLSKKDKANTTEFTIKNLNNFYRGNLSNTSPKLAEKTGRGLTAATIHIDEGPFVSNIDIVVPSALPASTAARDKAEEIGLPYGNIFTTTAGKKDDKDGKYVYEMVKNSSVWTESFFDCSNLEELKQLIRKSSPGGNVRVNCTFNHRQVGKTDEWLIETLQETNSSGEQADRDFFNIWTSGTNTSPLTSDQAKLIRDSEVSDPYFQVSENSYVFRWYIPLGDIERVMNSRNHILSIDTSDASGNDDIAMTLRSVSTGETVAAANINETNLYTYAQWLSSLIIKYEKMVTIIERRSSGVTIIDILFVILSEKGVNPFKRLYNTVVQNKDDKPDQYETMAKHSTHSSLEIANRYKSSFGFATSGGGNTSRSMLYGEILMESVKNTGSSVRDKMLIDQILGLVIRNGRVDHGSGEHDDMCISWLFSYWMLSRGKNLSFYGINPRDILSENMERKSRAITKSDIYEERKQEKLKEELNYLIEKIKETRDSFETASLETRLRKVLQDVNLTGSVQSVDELLDKLKEEKKLDRSLNQKQRNPIYGRFRPGNHYKP